MWKGMSAILFLRRRVQNEAVTCKLGHDVIEDFGFQHLQLMKAMLVLQYSPVHHSNWPNSC